jgi:2-amino-4-hydroxy-6-hydroxymethyldihydropteridine diphosphokinase
MHDVYLGLGSNVGERILFIARAVKKLKASRSVHFKKVSGIYETEPVGIREQAKFLNAAVWAETSFSPHELLVYLKSLEKQLGRRKNARWGPREIDIDILMYGDLVLNEPPLTIPHAEMNNRKFVLQPLAEIAPGAIHPALHVTVAALLARCTDTSTVERSEESTKSFLSIVEE